MKKIILSFVAVFFSNFGYSQLTEGFESTTGTSTLPINPTTWTLGSGNWGVFDNNFGTGVRWDINFTLPNQGTNAGYCNRENIGAGNTSQDFLATPSVLIPVNGQLKFWTRQFVATDFGTLYEIRVKPVVANTVAEQTNPTGYVTVQNWTEFSLNTTYNIYEEKTVSLSTYAGQNVYVAFVMIFTQPTATISGDRWLIDDVKINQACLPPTGLGAAPLQTSATLTWTNPGGATSYDIYNGLNPLAAPTASTIPTGTSTTNSFVQTPLLALTGYCYYVRANCGNGNLSPWEGPFCYATTIANDDCPNATVVPVNSNTTCTLVTPGTVTNATQSLPANTCTGNANDDVWFKFTATSTSHTISMINVTGSTTDLVHSVFSGTCGALTLLYCSDPNASTASNLTIGQTYYIRVYTWTATANQTSAFNVCIGTPPPAITTSTTQYTTAQLVQNVLLNSGCSTVSNITSSTGTNFGSTNGIGSFNRNGSTFPFNSGIMLSTGNVALAPGPEANTQSAGVTAWLGDADLNTIITNATGTAMNSQNASKLEFDFVPGVPNFGFNFVFASEEYGNWQCTFSDAFAFLLTDTVTGVTTNLALVPSTTLPISVVTIRNNLYNNSCASANSAYFDSYYGAGGLPALNSPTNFIGRTVPMSVASTLVVGRQYHIKLVVADNNDSAFDSAVFIEAGSFNISVAPVFTAVAVPATICAGSPYVLPTTSSNTPPITGNWTPAFNNTATTTYTFTPDPGQCASPFTTTIAITPNNTITLTSALNTQLQTLCVNTSMADINYTSTGATSGTITGLPAGVTGNWSGGAISITGSPSAVGTFNYTATPTGGCGTVTATGTITVNPQIVPTFTQVAAICSGDTLAALPTSSTNSPAITGTWSPTINNTATTTYTFTPTSDPCATTAIMTIVVNPKNVPTFSAPAPICSGGIAPTLPSSSSNMTPITGTWSPATVSNTATDTYTFTPDAGQCATTTTLTVTVDPSCSFDSYASAVWIDNCINTADTVKFYNTVGSGTSLIGPAANVFSSTNFGTYVQNSNTLILRGAEVKTYKVSSANVCGSNMYYRVYAAAATPPAFTTLPLPFFDNCSGVTFPTGGPCTTGDQKWQKVLNNSQSPVDLTAYAPGNYIIEVYYDITGSNTTTTGCTDVKLINNGGANFKANYTIQSTPTYTSTNPTTCNANNGTITISGLIPFTTYAITYTDDGTVVGPVNMLSNGTGQIVITGLNAGTYTAITTLINACTSVSVAPIVLVNPITVPTFNPVAAICNGGTLSPLPTTSLNGIVGVWSPALNNTVNTQYTFTPNANQCTTTPLTTLTITVNQPITPTFAQVGPICTGAVFAALPTSSTNIPAITGTWSPAVNNTATTTYTFTPTAGQCATTTPMTVTISPNNTIALSSAVGTNTTQSVCIGTGITNITYDTTGATGATVTPLPAGVTGVWLNNVLTISGTPTGPSGTFNYVATLTGGCGTITANGTIVVKANTSILLSSGVTTPTQTRCKGVVITNIRYTTSGATNATVTGLPTGITGNWTTNVMTISGSSTVVGVYPYTVTTVGGCGTVSLSGTITISPDNTIVLNSAIGTNAQTVCVGTPITNINYTTSGATGATIAGLPTGVTGSWNATTGYTITGTPSVTVASPYTYTISLTGGCNNPIVRITGTITVTPLTPTTFAIASSVCNGGTVPVLPTSSTNTIPITGIWSPNLISNTASASYLFTPTTGQCATPYTLNFVVNPLPAAPTVSIISQPTCTAGGQVDITSPLNSTTLASNLFISEVTDAETGSLTYVEIYNGTGVTKNLANYKLKIYNNGNTFTSCDLALTGTIANNSVNVIKLSGDTGIAGVTPNQTFATCLGINTDDNIKLTTSADVVVDNWGRSDGMNFTPNNQTGYVYRRLATATVPNTVWNPADWSAIDPEDYTNLGGYAYLTNTYLYNVDGGPYQPGVSFTPLASGSHTFTVLNTATGCVSAGTTISLNPIAGIVTPTFTQVAAICSGDVLSALPTSSTNSPAITGTWSPALNNTATTTYTFTPAAGQCATTQTMTITVNPNNTIALISPTSTVAQTVCNLSPITNIVYTTTNATGATVTGLPNGVTASWASNVLTISGTPTVNGFQSYSILLTGGCGNTTSTGAINVIPKVTPTFTQVAAICSGAVLAALPTSSTNSPAITGTWSPALNNTVTTTYTFTPTTGLCATTQTMTITVNPIVTPTFAAYSSATVCESTTIQPLLATTSDNAITGTWSPNTINYSTIGATTYTFTPTAGQCANTISFVITVNAKVTPTFTQVAAICNGDVLSALPTSSTNSPAITGTWSPALNNTATTTYTFTPTTGLCATTQMMTITVNAKVTPTISNIASICYGSVAPTLPVPTIGGSPVTGTWSPSIISNTATGSYQFTPAAGQCANTPAPITVMVQNDINYNIAGGCNGNNYVLNVDASFSNYTWTNSSNVVVGTNDASFNVSNYLSSNSVISVYPMVFSVTVTNTNGCTKTKSFSISGINCAIQKGISPNNDGRNDSFDLQGMNVANLEIFNRYGIKVYTQSNYSNEWFGQTTEGVELPDGTYYYQIEFKNNRDAITGWIYINREN